MSAALVRQALEFVDPEGSSGKGKKRGARRGDRHQGSSSQASTKPLKQKVKKNLEKSVVEQNKVNIAIRQLLKLSRPTVDSQIADKIVERAVTGKALVDKIQVNNEPEKSILFSDNEEEFDKFEEELFCS